MLMIKKKYELKLKQSNAPVNNYRKISNDDYQKESNECSVIESNGLAESSKSIDLFQNIEEVSEKQDQKLVYRASLITPGGFTKNNFTKIPIASKYQKEIQL